jgi:hypothetical protein
MKNDENDKDKDNCLLPLCRQDTKKGKYSRKVQTLHELLIVIGGLLLLLLIIIVVVGGTSGTDAKSSQLSRSQ